MIQIKGNSTGEKKDSEILNYDDVEINNNEDKEL